MSTKKKNADYLKQGGILAMASLIVRIIGMVYRIPMSNILGEEGNGIYAVAFEIYDLMLIISSYSLPLALSKMISARQANKEHKNTGRILKVALRFAIISGGVVAVVLFFGAGVIEHTIYPEYSGVQIPLRVLAPTIFIVALLGVFRGFFQGKRTMIPTAVSQIIEQVINAIVSVAASYLFMKWNAPVDQMFERLEEKDPEHFAVRQYRKFLLSAGKTRSSILISCGARLAPFDIREVRELMDDLEAQHA